MTASIGNKYFFLHSWSLQNAYCLHQICTHRAHYDTYDNKLSLEASNTSALVLYMCRTITIGIALEDSYVGGAKFEFCESFVY